MSKPYNSTGMIAEAKALTLIAEELRRANEIEIAKLLSEKMEDQLAHLRAMEVI